MASNAVRECSKLLAEKELTMACAESATAGRLMSEFSLVAESGKVLIGGLVCYDGDVKTKVLGVPKEMLKQYSPESAEVTTAAAKGLRSFLDADLHIAVTGLTTPGGSESPDKPVGTMFACILWAGKERHIRQAFSGFPEQIIMQTVDRIAAEIISLVKAG